MNGADFDLCLVLDEQFSVKIFLLFYWLERLSPRQIIWWQIRVLYYDFFHWNVSRVTCRICFFSWMSVFMGVVGRQLLCNKTGWNWSRDSKVTSCREHNLHKTDFQWLRLELIYPDESSFIWVCILCPLLPCHSFHYPSFCVAVYCQLGRTWCALELLWLLTGRCACASCLEGQRQWVVRLW